MTLAETFCRRHECHEGLFRQQIFQRCMPGWTRPVALILRVLTPGYFVADERFVIALGEAVTMEEVRREARDFLQLPANQGWLRRVGKIRLSATRAISLAKEYLPENDR